MPRPPIDRIKAISDTNLIKPPKQKFLDNHPMYAKVAGTDKGVKFLENHPGIAGRAQGGPKRPQGPPVSQTAYLNNHPIFAATKGKDRKNFLNDHPGMAARWKQAPAIVMPTPGTPVEGPVVPKSPKPNYTPAPFGPQSTQKITTQVPVASNGVTINRGALMRRLRGKK